MNTEVGLTEDIVYEYKNIQSIDSLTLIATIVETAFQNLEDQTN